MLVNRVTGEEREVDVVIRSTIAGQSVTMGIEATIYAPCAYKLHHSARESVGLFDRSRNRGSPMPEGCGARGSGGSPR